jgi:hypothetical protein
VDITVALDTAAATVSPAKSASHRGAAATWLSLARGRLSTPVTLVRAALNNPNSLIRERAGHVPPSRLCVGDLELSCECLNRRQRSRLPASHATGKLSA